MTEVQQHPPPPFLFVLRDQLRLEPYALNHQLRERRRLSRPQLSTVRFTPRKEGLVSHDAVLDSFGEPCRALHDRKSRKAADGSPDQNGLVEGSHEVLACVDVDAGLAADSAVHHCEQRGGHQGKGKASQGSRSRKPCEIAGDTTA